MGKSLRAGRRKRYSVLSPRIQEQLIASLSIVVVEACETSSAKNQKMILLTYVLNEIFDSFLSLAILKFNPQHIKAHL